MTSNTSAADSSSLNNLFCFPKLHDGTYVTPDQWDDLAVWVEAFKEAGWQLAKEDEVPDISLGVGGNGRLRRYNKTQRMRFHDKRSLFRALQEHNLPFVPQTEFALQDVADKIGDLGDIWFFKLSLESKGRGVYPFTDPSEISETVRESGAEQGVFQKNVPNMLLWDGAKFDLRVLVAFGPGKTASVCPKFWVRKSKKPFDASNMERQVQCTNISQEADVLYCTDLDKQFGEGVESIVRERVFDCVARTCAALEDFFPHSDEGRWHYFGFDLMLDEDFSPWLLEVNSTPHLINCNTRVPGSVVSALTDLLVHNFAPYGSAKPSSCHSASRGGWVVVFDGNNVAPVEDNETSQ